MTNRTAEQIASTVLQSFPTLATAPAVRDIRAAIAEGIRIDRAQHDIDYAREIIDRREAQAVIWSPREIANILDERIKSGRVAAPHTQIEHDAIVDRALESSYWRGLSDCSERDWVLLDLALDDALTNTPHTPADAAGQ